MSINFLPQKIRDKYEIHEWKHACAVLKEDFSDQWEDIIDVLNNFKLKKSDVIKQGGRLSPISDWFNQAFCAKGWIEKSFETQIVVDRNPILVLFGVRGHFRTLQPGRRQVNIISSRKREHSHKPDELYPIIESCSPGPYLELFARHKREGWQQWGNGLKA